MASSKWPLILFQFITVLSLYEVFGKRHEIRLDEKFLFAWEVNNDNGTIILEATGETGGYVGLGFNRKGKMDKAEMCIGGIHLHDGNSYFGVYKGHKHKVILDKKRKWTLLEATRNDTHTYLKYERPLGGNDPSVEIGDEDLLANYIPIRDKDIYVIWALGKSDKLKKHHGHGKLKINLINPHEDYLQYWNNEMLDFSVDF